MVPQRSLFSFVLPVHLHIHQRLEKGSIRNFWCHFLLLARIKSAPVSTYYTPIPLYLLQCWGNSNRNFNTPGEDVTFSDQGCKKIPSMPIAVPESAIANAWLGPGVITDFLHTNLLDKLLYFSYLPCFPRFPRQQVLLERTGLERLLQEHKRSVKAQCKQSPLMNLWECSRLRIYSGFVLFRKFLVKWKDEECCIAPGLISWELLRC